MPQVEPNHDFKILSPIFQYRFHISILLFFLSILIQSLDSTTQEWQPTPKQLTNFSNSTLTLANKHSVRFYDYSFIALKLLSIISAICRVCRLFLVMRGIHHYGHLYSHLCARHGILQQALLVQTNPAPFNVSLTTFCS
jgi:hypothetical protein